MAKRGKRLELTWANKDMRLLAHDDVSYEWVDPSDWRVSEVRLLQEVDSFGEDDCSNLLVQGDALHALTALSSWPEISNQFVGQVKLCYIDPPFNTGQAFRDYDDAVEHSVWLTMLRDRLVQIKKLLRPDGSVWVHLDDAESHRARCVLDEVFGAENFVATVIWQKADSPRSDAMGLSVSHDSLIVYKKSAAWSPNRLPRLESTDATFGSQDGDPVLWRKKDPTAPGAATHQGMVYAVQHPISGQMVYPGVGRCWAMEQSWMLTEMSRYARYELRDIGDSEARARICGTSPNDVRGGVMALVLVDDLTTAAAQAQAVYDAGNWPTIYLTGPRGSRGFQRKQHISDNGRVPDTWWPHTDVGHNRAAKNEIKALFPGKYPFATPKPERLLERVLHIGSNKGDLVLDCFAGSGTTAAVAHKMSRRWVTVELSMDNVTSFVRPRLEKVVKGEDPGGITAAVEWEGGGGFRQMVVGPSMFEDIEGTVVLADWATGGELTEAVAAQLGYTFEPDGPYAGRKGRSRLAVLDGMLTRGVADHLLGGLGERETLMVVAQALEPGVEEHVREVRSGSRARKVPRDLAHVGRRPSRLVRLGETQDGEGDG